MGGSLFRIHRDTRFSSDKAPYKPWQGARIFHARRREVAAPSFYVHVEPGNCFVGAGLWHPETHTQRRVRQFIHENPAGWTAASRAPAFRRRYTLDDSRNLVRMPAGYPADSPLAEDLKRRAATEGPDETIEKMDEIWQEEQVTFMGNKDPSGSCGENRQLPRDPIAAAGIAVRVVDPGEADTREAAAGTRR